MWAALSHVIQTCGYTTALALDRQDAEAMAGTLEKCSLPSTPPSVMDEEAKCPGDESGGQQGDRQGPAGDSYRTSRLAKVLFKRKNKILRNGTP